MPLSVLEIITIRGTITVVLIIITRIMDVLMGEETYRVNNNGLEII